MNFTFDFDIFCSFEDLKYNWGTDDFSMFKVNINKKSFGEN